MELVNQSDYQDLLEKVSGLLAEARQQAVRTVNTLLVQTYWQIGRRIVEEEQGGSGRAEYGEGLLKQLSRDLTQRFGRGFSVDNLETMRQFYLRFPPLPISDTPSRKSRVPESQGPKLPNLPLSWSHYALLVRRAKSPQALEFYHAETLRGGWSVRQLERQIDSQFYERAALSKNKAALLEKAPKGEALRPEEAIKDPFVLEFLNLKDEYSEGDLEEALIRQLEGFLLELGSDFAFVGRQRRLRIGDDWYRVDLVMFHRKLRCLVLIDLKLGKLTHADAGQMHTYLNYARKHWTNEGENPPVGLILCSDRNQALAQYALEGLSNTVLAAEYQTRLPDEEVLVRELERTRKVLEARAATQPEEP